GTDGADHGTVANAFIAFLQISDPGSMAQDQFSSQWFMVAAIVAGTGGVIMVSILIAFVTTALDTRLSKLRRGHSQVVENGHTLILGWEEQRVVEIIRELAIANESERKRAVVVLADRDKEYMDDYLSLQLPDTKTTRVITRSGSPASLANLGVVSVATAKSAVVLAECSEAAPAREKAESDARVIKTLLALEADQSTSHRINVVAELFGVEARSMCDSIGVGSITAVDITSVLARILVQTSRSVGLSVVYNEVLSFEGAEFYVFQGLWEGLSFRDASCRFPNGMPIAIKAADGSITINPDLERGLADTDQLIVLAEDDSTIRFEREPVATQREMTAPGGRKERRPERQLVIGWGPKAERLVGEYAEYVLPGSRVDIMPRSTRGLDPHVEGLVVEVLPHDPLDPRTWETVDPLNYDHVILLSEGDPDATAEAVDAETIMILLLLRGAIRRAEGTHTGRNTTVVTELVESGNQVVAPNVGVHDFVISSRIVSMLFAQIAEQPDMHELYESLLHEEGSEIYVKPISLYVSELPTELPFCDLMTLANSRGEICIGTKTKSKEDRADLNYGVRLVPHKDEGIKLAEGDALVVLAEDEG
ncbi:MAG: hypothetical protein U9R47_05825, partial [Actinomycetota bacterium]|nr:hypothetical protein [Actinomycetota bacterium]